MKFIYAAILILLSNQALALDWEKRASHKFQDEDYVVYVSTNTSSHERAKLCIEDIFGDPLYEIPLNSQRTGAGSMVILNFARFLAREL